MKAEAQSKLVLDDTPKEVRVACLAQIQECDGQRDEIIAALAHIDSDDFDPLEDEDRALVFDDLVEPLPATVPVSGDEHAHATVDATDDDLAADKPATPNRHAHGTSAWFVPQDKKKQSWLPSWFGARRNTGSNRLSACTFATLLASVSLGAASGFAVPPVPVASSDSIEHQAFSGKAFFPARSV